MAIKACELSLRPSAHWGSDRDKCGASADHCAVSHPVHLSRSVVRRRHFRSASARHDAAPPRASRSHRLTDPEPHDADRASGRARRVLRGCPAADPRVPARSTWGACALAARGGQGEGLRRNTRNRRIVSEASSGSEPCYTSAILQDLNAMPTWANPRSMWSNPCSRGSARCPRIAPLNRDRDARRQRDIGAGKPVNRWRPAVRSEAIGKHFHVSKSTKSPTWVN